MRASSQRQLKLEFLGQTFNLSPPVVDLDLDVVQVAGCRSRRRDAMEALTIIRYTWPSATVRAFGCVDVLSWDRRLDSAMFAYTERALRSVGPLLAGDKSRQCTKTGITRQHRSVLGSH